MIGLGRSSALAVPVPSAGGAWRRLGLGVASALAALAAAYALLHGPTLAALGLCLLPLVLWLLGRPERLLLLLGASIPITYSLTGGRGGFNLSPSDLLLVFVGAGILFQAVATDALPAWRALRPVKSTVGQYVVLLALLLAIHLGVTDVAQTAQRLELFLLPLVVGAFAALNGRHLTLLKGYVVAATALAGFWPFAHGLGQKNPVGQMIVASILVLVGVKALRRYTVCALVLVPGLFFTGSRGAIVAGAVGGAVLLALQESRGRALFARLSVVGLLGFVTYAMLPVSLQSRLSTFSAGTGTRAAYALHIREQYISDAEKIIQAHPVTGVGVGNYLAGNRSDLTGTTDPHNVLLLQAAEGGYIFALSFAILIAGTTFALRRLKRIELAPVAAAVLLATFAHGLVDIYWVRGTPLLGWLLVGMACAQSSTATRGAEERAA